MYFVYGELKMIDSEGYRHNVGIIVSNNAGKLLWARRIGQDAWQFPQGGIRENESAQEAMYRELKEELGLEPEHVSIMGQTRDWLRYDLPKHLIRSHCKPLCIGQKQVWFMLSLIAEESNLKFDACDIPEFDGWRWVNYWYPVKSVVWFKRKVYHHALNELAPLIHKSTLLQRSASKY